MKIRERGDEEENTITMKKMIKEKEKRKKKANESTATDIMMDVSSCLAPEQALYQWSTFLYHQP